MARALNEMIRAEGHEAVALRERFDPRVQDIDYFRELGRERDWIVISKDLANHRRAPERRVIMASGVLAFYLSSALQKKSPYRQLAAVLWQWGRLVDYRTSTANGMFQLPENKGSKFRSL